VKIFNIKKMIEEKKKKKKSHYTEFRAASAFQKAPALLISSFTIKNRHFGGVFHIKIEKKSVKMGQKWPFSARKHPFFAFLALFSPKSVEKGPNFL
jgi:hypothetical protein